LELRRLQREDRQPRNAPPRARNTAELLARYQAQGSTSRTIQQTEPIEQEPPQRSTRAFGLPSFKKQTNGYQKL
jgi:hypothetical protein